MQKRICYVLLGWLLLFGWQNTFAQSDTLCDPNENKKIFGELYFNYGSVTNAYSAFNRSTFVMGQPLASPRNMLSQGYQAGFGVYSPWYLPPQPPILGASQGDFKDRIKISWNVNPLSTPPTGFVLYRDGSFLADLGEGVREFLDFNTQAGEYYEYSIVAKNVFGTGSPSKFVGFVNPNGVVSGKVETNSGNPVPGVEVRLTPLTGNSMAFDGVDDELCVTYHDEFPTDKFTVSAYVKLGDGNNESGIIDWGSSLNKNWWITTTPSGEPKGYVFHIGNGTSSDSLKYYLPNSPANPENVNNWHQVTMVYNGSALSVLVDGEFVGTKPASIVREKNYVNIGSKIGNDGFFRGKIDDIRVYNRPLTQTEVNNTKNRSVSKSETGLISYWKMDEGIGIKVFDNTTIPTNANVYGATFSSDKPEVYSAGVTDVTGYYVIDGINYSMNESFRATPMKNFEFNSALEFNAADKSYGNLKDYDIPDTSTIQVLFHPFDLKSRQTILSKGSLYEAYIDNGDLFLNLNGSITNLGAIQAKYYHLAVALDNTAGNAKIYLEGELKKTVSFAGTSNWQNGSSWLLATNSTSANTGNFYTGLIDEFLIYKTELPQDVIQKHFVVGIPQDSTTALLWSYFDLNEGSDTKVFDYASINFGSELPREGDILKAAWSNNARRKETKAHEFEPNIRVVNLNTSNTAIGNIDFKAVSTVNVSGTVRFANTFCFGDQVEIKVNGQSHFPPIYTDKDGKWSADFEPGRTVKLSAEYKDHLFTPSFFEIRKLQAPKAGIVFLNNTKRKIVGQVAGNAKGRKSIIPEGARVVVKVATLDGCFERTDTLRNPDGKFVFNDLPARAFTVSVVEHSNSIIYNYLQLKGGQEVDLRDIATDTTDFIYVAPPNVEIEPFPSIVCAGGQSWQIIPQSQSAISPKYKKKIRIYEQYDGGKFYVDNAKLIIENQIQGSDTETIQMDSSTYVYEFLAGAPNIISPYKKTMQVTAIVDGASATATDDVIVVGKRSRETTFTTEAPSDKPIWILRDPPGDGSSATLEAGSTKCTAYSNSFATSKSGELTGAVEIGKKVTTFVGVGAGVIEENGAVVTNTLKGKISYNGGSTNETEVCYTTTESYSTSSGDNIVGRMADVFIGTSMNFEYGINDMIYYDEKTCSIKDSVGIWLDPKKFGTQYVYSRWQVMTDVIPSLESLGKSEDAKRWRKILKEDEYYLVQKPDYSNKINDIINRVIDFIPASSVIPDKVIDPIKKIINTTVNTAEDGIRYIIGASNAPDTVRYEPIFDKNVTFDGLSNYTSTFSKEDKKASTTSWSLGSDFSHSINGEVTVFGLDVNTTLETTTGGSYESTSGSTDTKTTTISYTLADDDPNDNFSVDIYKKGDLPLFKLKAGESMCPWEFGTLNREEVGFTADYTRQINVPANTLATFPIHLQNLGQTGNDPLVYIIGEVTSSNPRGAKITLNGESLLEPRRFQLQPKQQLDLLLTIEKGPIDYNYDSLKIFFASECMYQHSLGLGYDLSTNLGYLVDETGVVTGFNAEQYKGLNSKFYKQLKLGVEFIEPCSPVDISSPRQDFVLIPAAENKLSITLNEYNKADEDLKLIRLQYRPIGGDGSWINISETYKAELGDLFTLKEWNTELLKDGPFEIRAVAECFNTTLAPGISTIIRGTLEREPPVVFGVPEPGDGTWDPGDEISITFNEAIDCDKLVQADMLANNTIGLYDATTNALVDATINCVGNKIMITPNINPVFFENRTFRVVVSGKDYDDAMLAQNPNHQRAAIRDKAGNMIEKTIKWEFAVNQNNLEWVGTDVIETNEVLKPFSVKRQIRNRGGSIASFRMESVPSWLTVTPATGTLNPGQVADVTLTFQQDLLIGDYLDTLQMVGSRGAEPLLIDYRVRCPQPIYEVDNPTQYEGSMNMVVDLSIFGITSTDPSDVIVAKIDGKIRGVGRVAYFRSIPADKQRWLTFLTIFGNSEDAQKPIEFSVWDGDKCNEYVEILENYTFQVGNLVGSPLEPTPVSVLNLVKKCIPLNRGFNWVSFNLDLGEGRNTVTNVLSTLKNKRGAYIKTDDSFAEFLDGYGWDALDSLIYPTKRYMVFVSQRDTICLKGAPYNSSQHPISVKNSWNWLGYIPSTGMTVNQALSGLRPLNGDIIKSQTLFAQYVAGVGWIGNLNFLEPLKGYLLKISNAGTLTYPTLNTFNLEQQEVPSEEVVKGLELQRSYETPMTIEFAKYEQTMNLIGQVNGIKIASNDELRAYVDGQLISISKPLATNRQMLFFNTVYFHDEQAVSFKLYKADRDKLYDLDKSIAFKAETVVGMVNDPVVFNLVTDNQEEVTITLADNIIKQPTTVFPSVSIAEGIDQADANCTTYLISTILPTGNETKPSCTSVTQDGNMSTVIRMRFNEKTNFVSSEDVLTFVNSSTKAVLGCATFRDNLFYGTIAGPNNSTTFPVDVIYYSNTMKKSFTLKSAFNYQNNSRLGNAVNPTSLDASPLAVTVDSKGVVTTVVRDTSWVGDYCVQVFALNCAGYNDGETSYCMRRLQSNDCSYSFAKPTSNSPICKGDTLFLTTNEGDSYEWKGPNGFTSTEQNPVIPNIDANGSGEYSVTVTNYRCPITSTVKVDVKTVQMMSSSNSPVCELDTLKLMSSGGVTYKWSGPNNFSSTEQNPVLPKAGLQAAGTYKVVISSANGCTDSTTTAVEVKALPINTSPKNLEICATDTLRLMATGGTKYAWTGPNGFTSTLQNPILPNVKDSTAGKYIVTITSDGMCSITDTVSVKIKPLPQRPTIVGEQVACAGQEVILQVTADALATFRWSNGSVGNRITVSPTATTSYTVEASLAGCARVSEPFEIKVTPLNPSPVIKSDNHVICKGGSVILTAECSAVTDIFRWVTPSSLAVTSGGSNTDTRKVTEPGTYRGYCIPKEGCTSAETVVVIAADTTCNTGSFITVTPAKPVICPNTSVTLSATGCAGTLTWLNGTTNQTGTSITVRPTVNTTYLVQCSTGGSTTVDVAIANTSVVVGSNVTTGVEKVKAVERIQSNKRIGDVSFTPAPNVTYEAGRSIELQPGFVVDAFSVFSAQIKTCPQN